MRPKAINVKPKDDYILEIEFDNGEIKLFDVKPYLNHIVFQDLKNIEEFNKVKINGLSVAWENGADICPDELYKLSK